MMSSTNDVSDGAKPPMVDKKRLKKMFSWTDDGV